PPRRLFIPRRTYPLAVRAEYHTVYPLSVPTQDGHALACARLPHPHRWVITRCNYPLAVRAEYGALHRCCVPAQDGYALPPARELWLAARELWLAARELWLDTRHAPPRQPNEHQQC